MGVVERTRQYATVIAGWLRRIPAGAWHVLALITTTRVVLTLIGLVGQSFLRDQSVVLFQFSRNPLLNVWGRWDTTFYYEIALHGYNNRFEYTWFPFYSLIMRAVNYAVNDVFVAGLIISNVALIIACVYLYKLVRLDHDDGTAMRSVKYMILWPTAFILSAVLSEATYVAIIIAAIYYARKGRWIVACSLGSCLALTRAIGIFVIVPLGIIYVQQLSGMNGTEHQSLSFRERIGRIGGSLRRIRPDALAFLLIPLAYGLWMLFNYYTQGDPLSFFHTQSEFYGRGMYSVLSVITGGFGSNPVNFTNALVATVILVLLAISVRLIPFSYWAIGIYSILIPMSTGIMAIPRYSLAIFPLYIICGRVSKNRATDITLTIVFGLLQGCCMTLWGNYAIT